MEDIHAKLESIENSVVEIKVALLGNLDRSQKGVLVETEQLRKEMDEIKPALSFYKNGRVIVGAIAVTVPFLFELVKLSVSTVWTHLK